jgi:hypothetical protein
MDNDTIWIESVWTTIPYGLSLYGQLYREESSSAAAGPPHWDTLID